MEDCRLKTRMIVQSALVVAISIIISLVTNAFTNVLFGTLGLDNFIVVYYCVYLYIRKEQSNKIILSTHIIHPVLALIFRSSVITASCAVLSQSLALAFLFILGFLFQKFNIKDFNKNHCYTQTNLLVLIVSLIMSLSSTIIFAYISYALFGLPYWLYITSVWLSPLSAILTVGLVGLWYLYGVRMYPRQIRRLFFN